MKTQNYMTSIVLASLFAVALAPLFAQSSSASSENAAIERYAADKLYLTRNIHDAQSTAMDGHKGFGTGAKRISTPIQQADGGGEVSPSPYKDALEEHLYFNVCRVDAIVVAKEISSTVGITNNRALIYTKHTVNVERLIKGSDTLAGQQIIIIQPGGTISDQGEQVTINNSAVHPVLPGQTYLYFLVHLEGASASTFVPLGEREEDDVRVVSGHIHLQRQSNDNFVEGEQLAQVSGQIKQLIRRVPCSSK